MVEQLDCYCGMYCGGCFILKAFKENNRKFIPEKWNWITEDIPLECHGCKSDTLFIGCQYCKIRKCASEKQIDFCNLCEDYKVCEYIKNWDSHENPHHFVAKHNLNLIQQSGKEEWLKDQKIRWQCKKCNHPFSWYEEKCDKCGETLLDFLGRSKIITKIVKKIRK